MIQSLSADAELFLTVNEGRFDEVKSDNDKKQLGVLRNIEWRYASWC